MSIYLREKGVHVVNCTGDADSEIVRVAVNAARHNVGIISVVADQITQTSP